MIRVARTNRQNVILDIIKNYEIDTQEELVERLIQMGCLVTQATVSRDIKNLELVKVPGIQKKYRYMQVGYTQNNIQNKFGAIFKESVLHIQTARNIVVIKTVEGGANSACAFIDNLNLSDLLGSIAGDDTIMAIAPTDEKAIEIANLLKNYF